MTGLLKPSLNWLLPLVPVAVGLRYLAPDAQELHEHLNTTEVPFNQLGEKDLCPGAGMLEKINAALR